MRAFPPRMLTNPMRPFKLHRGLAEAAIGKNSGAALCQRPPHDVLLEVVQLIVEVVHGQGDTVGVYSPLRFVNNEISVIFHPLPPGTISL